MHPLHKLQVYAQATAFARLCHAHCVALADRDLRWQLLRAARSIAANLAEGAGSDSQAAFARYISIALVSAKETECHLHIAHDAALLPTQAFEELMRALNHLSPRLVRRLCAVRANAKRRTTPQA